MTARDWEAEAAAKLEAQRSELAADRARIGANLAWLEAARIRGEHQDRILGRLKYVLIGLSVLWCAGLALAIWGLTQR